MAKKNIKLNLPDNLEDETIDFINSVYNYLKKNEKFNIIDSAALRMLTTSYNTYIKAAQQLDEEGLTYISDRGNVGQHPAFGIMKNSISTAMSILTEFGLTLKSRSRLNIIENETEESPLLKFLENNV